MLTQTSKELKEKIKILEHEIEQLSMMLNEKNEEINSLKGLEAEYL